MSDVTQILQQIEKGDPSASEQLLPLVYAELRKLAAAKLATEKPGQTLQATALVHEAYLRLLGGGRDNWNSRGHFFGAAAEAMRRILVERARHKATLKAGGQMKRVELAEPQGADLGKSKLDMIALDEALNKLEASDPRRASVVKLRFFAGLTSAQAAAALGITRSTADADWAYAKSWLKVEMSGRDRERP